MMTTLLTNAPMRTKLRFMRRTKTRKLPKNFNTTTKTAIALISEIWVLASRRSSPRQMQSIPWRSRRESAATWRAATQIERPQSAQSRSPRRANLPRQMFPAPYDTDRVGSEVARSVAQPNRPVFACSEQLRKAGRFHLKEMQRPISRTVNGIRKRLTCDLTKLAISEPFIQPHM
jgi:hypothetical protein